MLPIQYRYAKYHPKFFQSFELHKNIEFYFQFPVLLLSEWSLYYLTIFSRIKYQNPFTISIIISFWLTISYLSTFCSYKTLIKSFRTTEKVPLLKAIESFVSKNFEPKVAMKIVKK